MRLDSIRLSEPASPHGVNYGAFRFGDLLIISSGTPELNGPGWPWEHVSVSHPYRCPTWDEMDLIKNKFWSGSETVVQFHPRLDNKVNLHPRCLHLWKNIVTHHELPPRELIG